MKLEAELETRGNEDPAKGCRELEKQRLRLQTIVANVPGIVWETWHTPIASPEKVDFASEYVQVMLGYSVKEYLRQHFWLSIVHPDDRIRVAREAIETLKTGGQRRSEFRMTRKDKRTIWVEANYAVIKDDDGNSVGMRGVTTDITSRKHTEEQLRQSQKMEAIGQLAGGVAHDFNNLLTAINGYSELALRRVKTGDSLRKNLEEIRKAGNRAATLTRQLLTFGRRQVVELCVLNLNSIIADVENMLRRLIGEDIELKTELSKSIHNVKADAGQIEQVLMNLVENARDAMPEGGQVVIETATVQLCNDDHPDLNPGTYVMLTVSDTGVGMSRETQAHIFEPFFTTKRRGRGTGLGLSMVYGIVQQSNGHISVESEEKRGATFRVYLPAVAH